MSGDFARRIVDGNAIDGQQNKDDNGKRRQISENLARREGECGGEREFTKGKEKWRCSAPLKSTSRQVWVRGRCLGLTEVLGGDQLID
jgi:hypothetical protein